MGWDPAGDFAEVIDGLVPVTLVRSDGGPEVSVPYALRQAIRTREAAASAGRYTASDVVWHLPMGLFFEAPRPGDWIHDPEGKSWTILDVREMPQATRWRCVARHLAIIQGLQETLRIQKARFVKGPGGALQPLWEDWKTDVRARIQPEGGEISRAEDHPHIAPRWRIFLADRLALDHTHRFIGPDGAIYRIVAVRRPDRIDALLEVDVVAAT